MTRGHRRPLQGAHRRCVQFAPPTVMEVLTAGALLTIAIVMVGWVMFAWVNVSLEVADFVEFVPAPLPTLEPSPIWVDGKGDAQ